MQKYPRTKDGMAKRRNAVIASHSKHGAGRQFNPANGEPHTAKFLAKERAEGRRRKR